MARSSSFALLVSAAIAATGIPITGAIADAIAITNPSFESPTVAAGYNSALPTGWYNLNDAGTYGNLGGSPPVGGPVPPDGTQAAYVATTYGVEGSVASIFQRLGAAPVANAEYTLSVDVGRYGQPENYTNVQNLGGSGSRSVTRQTLARLSMPSLARLGSRPTPATAASRTARSNPFRSRAMRPGRYRPGTC
jgi:hypothetical protein